MTTKIAFFRNVLATLATGALVVGCVVQQAPPQGNGPPNAAQNKNKSADCRAQQDACVANCKSKAPDQASRQPCYNNCLRQSQACE